ncbi:hypothetical protein AK830_g4407 [Neonectria ditissima]|uniref:Uncharacterized protein n=1 Tax=Neonectria ditissima TaxID=78410 RepID=A0A0P7BG68_9HYPO|nr:hypothetical protein AK830_g4407 [Neonectria ditissima]
MRLLGDSRVKLDKEDLFGRTTLSWATQWGHGDNMDALWARSNMTTYPRDNEGWDLLTYAANQGHDALIQVLLGKSSADSHSTNFHVQKLPTWAKFRDYLDIANMISATSTVDGVDVMGQAHGLVQHVKAKNIPSDPVLPPQIQIGKADNPEQRLALKEHAERSEDANESPIATPWWPVLKSTLLRYGRFGSRMTVDVWLLAMALTEFSSGICTL